MLVVDNFATGDLYWKPVIRGLGLYRIGQYPVDSKYDYADYNKICFLILFFCFFFAIIELGIS